MNEWKNEWMNEMISIMGVLKPKTSKAKTLKTKTPKYLLDESFVFVFFWQSISVASAECLKSVIILKNGEI